MCREYIWEVEFKFEEMCNDAVHFNVPGHE